MKGARRGQGGFSSACQEAEVILMLMAQARVTQLRGAEGGMMGRPGGGRPGHRARGAGRVHGGVGRGGEEGLAGGAGGRAGGVVGGGGPGTGGHPGGAPCGPDHARGARRLLVRGEWHT